MVFGVITVLAGVSGTVSGSLLSMYLGRFTKKADAFVCSLGMLAATPALYLSITVVQYKQLYVAWVSPAGDFYQMIPVDVLSYCLEDMICPFPSSLCSLQSSFSASTGPLLQPCCW